MKSEWGQSALIFLTDCKEDKNKNSNNIKNTMLGLFCQHSSVYYGPEKTAS